MDNKDKKDEEENTVYPENGNNFSAGKADDDPMPNNPAENAERTSPEEDKLKKSRKDDKKDDTVGIP